MQKISIVIEQQEGEKEATLTIEQAQANSVDFLNVVTMELLPQCIREFIKILQPNDSIRAGIMENVAVKVILTGSKNITAETEATFIPKDQANEKSN